MLTEHLIKRQSGEYDPETIKRLKLENCSITSISNLTRCASLLELSLSMNDISVISGLDSLVNLLRLDLSYNRISKIENLDSLFSLAHLDLRCNKITATSDATAIAPLVNLKALYVYCEDSSENNPVCQQENYRREFLDALPQLIYFDGSHISLEHASSVMEAKLAAISPDLRCCQTPPLEPWLGDAAPSFADDAIDLAAEFDELQSSIEQTKAMINVDSTHLLKNAAAALSRAKNSL